MATLYVKLTSFGPTYGSTPPAAPLEINGVKVSSNRYSWHYEIGSGDSYFTRSVAGATFIKPDDYSTATYSEDHGGIDHPELRAWTTVSVPNDFVIPGELTVSQLPEIFEKEPSGSGFQITNTTFSWSTNIVAGLDFGTFSVQTGKGVIETLAEAATGSGFGSYAAQVQNSLTIKSALEKMLNGGIGIIDAGFAQISGQGGNARDFDRLVDNYLSGSQAEMFQTLADIKVAPNNPAAEAAIDGAIAGMQIIAQVNNTGAIPISGQVEAGIRFKLGPAYVEATITGTANADIIIDGAGKRTIYSGDGNDIVVAGLLGSKAVFTGNGIDRAYGGNDNDHISGGHDADALFGNKGRDVLMGEAGRDRLVGGFGNDVLNGGAGADVFAYRTVKESSKAASGRDTIVDFRRSERDKIDLVDIEANLKKGGNQKFTFIGRQEFHQKAGELRYEKQGKDIHVFGDTNGDGVADFSIQLKSLKLIGISDFFL